VAGFDIESPLQFDTPADAAATAAEVEPDVLVLCSADAEYPRLAPALRKGLDDHGLAPLLVVAGHPERIGGNLPVDEFVHAQRPLRDMLEAVQRRLGIPDELPSDA
jgi:methylmalonyl-CoA mutase cobalamin-binding subunit